ncbi:MAG: iron complex transport system substrate-binding protein [Granulosicoccus sp.]|jgi:iron complex transport system substrate-binding protein
MASKWKNHIRACFFGALSVNTIGANAHALAPSVLSINLCSDQMVMLLAEPSQIKALSRLSKDSAGSYFHQQAQKFPQVETQAEDILPLAPDVVLTGPYTPRHTSALLAELGLRVESLTIANSLEDMFANILLVGRILDQEVKAALIVKSLRMQLTAINLRVDILDTRMRNDGQSQPKAAVYDPNGYTVGRSSLRGEAMSLAGWHNVAEDKGIESYGVIHLEELIQLAPVALIESPYSADTYSRGQMVAKHPALRQAGLNPMIVALPSNQTICAGPWSVDIVAQLLEAREQLH